MYNDVGVYPFSHRHQSINIKLSCWSHSALTGLAFLFKMQANGIEKNMTKTPRLPTAGKLCTTKLILKSLITLQL